MKNREFREIQVSSTQLAIIFLGILVIGVVIFLLGVSVGKKHVQVAENANVIAQKEPEQIKEKISPLSQLKPEQEPGREPAGKSNETEPPEVPAKKEITPPTASKTTPLKSESKIAAKPSQQKPAGQERLYYVQVAALAEKTAAESTGKRFRDMGYTVVVMDPQASDRSPVYRVRVGGFPTREQADEVRAKLSAAAGRKTDYFIVRE